ncbi:hypothetical protein ACMD2_21955 [Ananas comosus]|uniref:Uncharacterized protein n=1 Tax=Ananas comosus TaxID=4615 RepID=A0A199VME2_ANACO|nr:hypothetical protein ACMD2_21955 [Ananas comosus]
MQLKARVMTIYTECSQSNFENGASTETILELSLEGNSRRIPVSPLTTSSHLFSPHQTHRNPRNRPSRFSSSAVAPDATIAGGVGTKRRGSGGGVGGGIRRPLPGCARGALKVRNKEKEKVFRNERVDKQVSEPAILESHTRLSVTVAYVALPRRPPACPALGGCSTLAPRCMGAREGCVSPYPRLPDPVS